MDGKHGDYDMKNKKRALRRYLTYIHAKKQQEINNFHNIDTMHLGYFKKQNAMDCGNSKCFLCGNVRKSKKRNPKDRITLQELKQNINYAQQIKDI